jgi:hypothetical protein
MKRIFLALSLAAVLSMIWVAPAAACNTPDNSNNHGNSNNTTGAVWSTSFYYKIGSGTITAQLIAGEASQKGTIIAWEESGNINIQYDLLDGWTMDQTSLFIGRGSTAEKAEGKIPQDKKGNYYLDKFKNKHTLDASTITDSYSISENTLGSGKWLCIAAYAEVLNASATLNAWGDLVSVGSWKLPAKPITLELWDQPGANNTYMDFNLTDVESGYSLINNEVYGGWCANNVWGIDYAQYSAKVYSSLNLRKAPSYIKSEIQWNNVNYLLNHCLPGTDFLDVQAAIWYFTNSGDNKTDEYWATLTEASQALITDAKANGNSFVPTAGQIGAVVFDLGTEIQPVFITLLAPTGCYKEDDCRHDCKPGWSPSQSWEPVKNHSCQWNWNHNNNNSTSHVSVKYHWNSSCTPQQNLNNYKKLCPFGH